MLRGTVLFALGFLCQLGAGDVSTNVDDLKYYYFPTVDQQIEVTFNDAQSVLSSGIQANIPTIFAVDGFLSNITTPMSTRTVQAYLDNEGSSVNVIVLDWGRLSGSGIALGNTATTLNTYRQASMNVGPVGQRLAQFIEFVRANRNIQYSDVTIVGHSLGAHVAGVAGRTVASNYGAQVSRIAGLDPAGPYVNLLAPKLRRGDAAFVDLYHSNAGTLGDIQDLGNVNIYINGGSSQPGCETADTSSYLGYCSHSYSWMFFYSQFTNPVSACPCKYIFSPSCTCNKCQVTCNGGITVGPNIDPSKSGLYYASSGPLQ